MRVNPRRHGFDWMSVRRVCMSLTPEKQDFERTRPERNQSKTIDQGNTAHETI